MAHENDAETEAAAVIAVTKEAGLGELRPLNPMETPLLSVTIPDGYTRETVDLRYLQDAPDRAEGMVELGTVQAFEAYVARHDDADATTLWVDPESMLAVAVLDDHESNNDTTVGTPGWGGHRARLQLGTTPAWDHWLGSDGVLLDQEAFAEHVEDGQLDVTSPGAAELLEIVSTMQGHTKAEWKNAVRLSDGQVQFVYSEESTATAGGAGELQIPATFKLAIAPFRGENAYELTARLRYRMSGGKLRIGYRLDRPADVLEDAIDGITDRLATRFGVERVFSGSPRPSVMD
jgi:uncharacterized protein YfdQ (DUF2303 family)